MSVETQTLATPQKTSQAPQQAQISLAPTQNNRTSHSKYSVKKSKVKKSKVKKGEKIIITAKWLKEFAASHRKWRASLNKNTVRGSI